MQTDWPQTIIGAVQTLVVIGGFLFTIRALRDASDARNVDFIIQAEGQVDPLFAAMLEESPPILKAILPELFPQQSDDIVIKKYAYTYFAYRHLSRIIYMLSNPKISLGMSDSQRQEFVDDWLNELKKYDQEVLKAIHAYCRQTGEFNDHFIMNMDRLYGFHEKDAVLIS